MIRAERLVLVEALAKLPETDWDRPTLCSQWSVREVVGHLIATAAMTPARFHVKLAECGGDVPRMISREIAETISSHSNAVLVQRYCSLIDARTAPPGPMPAWLGETVVHGEDIMRPLGHRLPHPVAHLKVIADFYTTDASLGGPDRVAGLRLRATDTDWEYAAAMAGPQPAEQPQVSGPLLALVLAMTGRSVALDELAGDGVTRLVGKR